MDGVRALGPGDEGRLEGLCAREHERPRELVLLDVEDRACAERDDHGLSVVLPARTRTGMDAAGPQNERGDVRACGCLQEGGVRHVRWQVQAESDGRGRWEGGGDGEGGVWTVAPDLAQRAADRRGENGGSGSAVEGDADVYADGDDEHTGGYVSSCFFDLVVQGHQFWYQNGDGRGPTQVYARQGLRVPRSVHDHGCGGADDGGMCGCGAGDDGGCEWECTAVDSTDGGMRRFKSEEEKGMEGVKGREDLFCLLFCCLLFSICLQGLRFVLSCTRFLHMLCHDNIRQIKSVLLCSTVASVNVFVFSPSIRPCHSLNFVSAPFEMIGHYVALFEGA
jgi:hypothetical protein